MTDTWADLTDEQKALVVDATRALIRSLLDWTPGPRAARTQALSGFRHGAREVSCDDCLANGRVMVGCETCRGTGTVTVKSDDPYQETAKTREQRFYGDETQRRRAEAQERDRQIDRLSLQLGGEDDRPDPVAAMIEKRDRQYRQGDYAPLERALGELRLVWPGLHSMIWRVDVCGVEMLVRPLVREAMDRAVASIVAPRMLALCGGVPRVPAALAGDLVARKAALWRGRSQRHERLRMERDERIRARVAGGEAVATVAVSEGLSVPRVYGIAGGTTTNVYTAGTAA